MHTKTKYSFFILNPLAINTHVKFCLCATRCHLHVKVLQTLFRILGDADNFRLPFVVHLTIKTHNTFINKKCRTYKFPKEVCRLIHDNPGGDSYSLHAPVAIQQETVHHVTQLDKLALLAKRTRAENKVYWFQLKISFSVLT